WVLRAAEIEAGVGAYRAALDLVDSVRHRAQGEDRARLLALRADLLVALGDPTAVAAYRDALAVATDDAVRSLRIRLARAATMGGDPATAEAALGDLEPDGGPDDAGLLFVRAYVAFLQGDNEAATTHTDRARE